MAVKILKDGEDISQMPIEYAPNFTKEYNKDICEELGVEVPDDYVAIGEALTIALLRKLLTTLLIQKQQNKEATHKLIKN